MKRSDLRRRVSMRLSDLEPILEELEKEGRIRISGDMVQLKITHLNQDEAWRKGDKKEIVIVRRGR